MMIKLLQPTISPTGIRYILDNEGRQIATVSALLDGIDNTARAKEAEYIHNAICESFNNAATLRAQNAELKHLLFLVTAPLERVAGSQNVPNMMADLAEDALSLIRATLAKYGDDNA